MWAIPCSGKIAIKRRSPRAYRGGGRRNAEVEEKDPQGNTRKGVRVWRLEGIHEPPDQGYQKGKKGPESTRGTRSSLNTHFNT